MEQPRRKPSIARTLAWLALAMILVAQCLPWEKVVIEKSNVWEGVNNANSCFLPIHRWWTFNLGQDDPFWPAGRHFLASDTTGPSVGTVTAFHGNPPELLPVNLAVELTHCAEGWADYPKAGMETLTVPAIISAYLMTIILMMATPFLTGPRQPPKTILWLACIFILLILAATIRNLVIGDSRFDSHACLVDYVGAGYWLTVAALGVEVVALFLISGAAESHSREKP
ncbi:MAG: hypothetical protein QM755_02190 [Luteolibacter sp.]